MAEIATKIAVTIEGRHGIYIADRQSLKAWIKAQNFEQIHNFTGAPPLIIGADHDVESVLQDIDNAERVGILTGAAQCGNIGHALALILSDGTDEHLEMYDIGKITEDDLEVDSHG